MTEHRRAADDIKEPQSLDELVRFIYRDMQIVKAAVFGNGKKGFGERLTILETIIRVLAAVASLEFAGLAALAAWLLLFKKGGG